MDTSRTNSSGLSPRPFYAGSVLWLDLTHSRAEVRPVRSDWLDLYIGGKGLLLRFLWDLVQPGMDPWAPESPILLISGPLSGTGVCACSRLVVGCKSPQTGILNDSYVGGSFAPEMKYAGYDAIVVTGESPEPVVVTIKNGQVSFIPAKPKYWGMKTSEIEDAMRHDFDPDCRTLSIGPAGEHEILWACVSTDQYHKAGRGGHGALWGRKGLKAIAIRGTGAVGVGDAREFLAHLLRFQSEAALTSDNLWLTEEGTPILLDPMNAAGAVPTRNWSQGSFEHADRINSDALQKILTGRRSCHQCAMACRQFHAVGDVRGEGPEYETIALCGPNCGIADIGALLEFNAECDEWGLDTISTGVVVGLAMDLAERGVKDLGLRFGRTQGYVEAPGLIATREGAGGDMALGARALADKYGRPELAMEVKNMELPGYDPRGSFGNAIAYATSDRGGCHMRAYPSGPEVLSGTMAPDTLKGKADFCIQQQNEKSARYSAVWCANFTPGMEQVLFMLSRVLQRDLPESEYLRIGERIWNLGRLFNLREGVERDSLPSALIDPNGAFRDGPSAGRSIGNEAFQAALQEYYSLRGWDEHGVPSEARLAELGVDVRL